MTATDTDWQTRAACRGVDAADANRFVTPGGLRGARNIAAEYCRRCPVRTECETARHGGSGVWAGKWYPARSHGRVGDPVELLDGAA